MDYLVKNLQFLTQTPGKGQTEAAAAMGLKQPAISKIVRGETQEPGFRTVAGLAAFYGVSLDAILNQDLTMAGIHGPSQAAGLDDATMAQGVELLYLLADARPDDPRFQRPSWAMIKIAAKAVNRAAGSPRDAMAEILAELAKES